MCSFHMIRENFDQNIINHIAKDTGSVIFNGDHIRSLWYENQVGVSLADR